MLRLLSLRATTFSECGVFRISQCKFFSCKSSKALLIQSCSSLNTSCFSYSKTHDSLQNYCNSPVYRSCSSFIPFPNCYYNALQNPPNSHLTSVHSCFLCTQTETPKQVLSEKPGEEEEKKISLVQRFKNAYKVYGKVLILVHGVTSVAWLGLFYLIAYG